MNILVSIHPYNADILGIIKINYIDAMNGYDVDKTAIDKDCTLIYSTLFNYIVTDVVQGGGTSLTELLCLLLNRYSESRILAECMCDDLILSHSYIAIYKKISKIIAGLPLHAIRFHTVTVTSNKKNLIIELT